jgi:hypothetical protein
MPRVQSEYEVETIFIDRLQEMNYTYVDLKNYDDVVDNFRKQLAKFNSEKLIEVKGDWKVPIFLDTLSMGQLILPTVHYRRHF